MNTNEKEFRNLANKFLIEPVSNWEPQKDSETLWRWLNHEPATEEHFHHFWIKKVINSNYGIQLWDKNDISSKYNLEEYLDKYQVSEHSEKDYIAWIRTSMIRNYSLKSLEILRKDLKSLPHQHMWNLWYVISRRYKWDICREYFPSKQYVYTSERSTTILSALIILDGGNYSIKELIESIVHHLQMDSFLSYLCEQQQWDLEQKIHEIVFDKLRRIRMIWSTIIITAEMKTSSFKDLCAEMILYYDSYLNKNPGTNTSSVCSDNAILRNILERDVGRGVVHKVTITNYISSEMDLLQTRDPRPPVLSDIVANHLDKLEFLIPILATNMDLVLKMSGYPRGCCILHKLIILLDQKNLAPQFSDHLKKLVWNKLVENIRFQTNAERPNAAEIILNYNRNHRVWECCVCFLTTLK